MTTSVRATRPFGASAMSDVQNVLDLIRQKGIQVVDLKFTDLPGQWQHFSLPARTVDEELFRDGIGFDGSSIRCCRCRPCPSSATCTIH